MPFLQAPPPRDLECVGCEENAIFLGPLCRQGLVNREWYFPNWQGPFCKNCGDLGQSVYLRLPFFENSLIKVAQWLGLRAENKIQFQWDLVAYTILREEGARASITPASIRQLSNRLQKFYKKIGAPLHLCKLAALEPKTAVDLCASEELLEQQNALMLGAQVLQSVKEDGTGGLTALIPLSKVPESLVPRGVELCDADDEAMHNSSVFGDILPGKNAICSERYKARFLEMWKDVADATAASATDTNATESKQVLEKIRALVPQVGGGGASFSRPVTGAAASGLLGSPRLSVENSVEAQAQALEEEAEEEEEELHQVIVDFITEAKELLLPDIESVTWENCGSRAVAGLSQRIETERGKLSANMQYLDEPLLHIQEFVRAIYDYCDTFIYFNKTRRARKRPGQKDKKPVAQAWRDLQEAEKLVRRFKISDPRRWHSTMLVQTKTVEFKEAWSQQMYVAALAHLDVSTLTEIYAEGLKVNDAARMSGIKFYWTLIEDKVVSLMKDCRCDANQYAEKLNDMWQIISKIAPKLEDVPKLPAEVIYEERVCAENGKEQVTALATCASFALHLEQYKDHSEKIWPSHVKKAMAVLQNPNCKTNLVAVCTGNSAMRKMLKEVKAGLEKSQPELVMLEQFVSTAKSMGGEMKDLPFDNYFSKVHKHKTDVGSIAEQLKVLSAGSYEEAKPTIQDILKNFSALLGFSAPVFYTKLHDTLWTAFSKFWDSYADLQTIPLGEERDAAKIATDELCMTLLRSLRSTDNWHEQRSEQVTSGADCLVNFYSVSLKNVAGDTYNADYSEKLKQANDLKEFCVQNQCYREILISGMRAFGLGYQTNFGEGMQTEDLLRKWKEWQQLGEKDRPRDFPVLEALVRLGSVRAFLGSFPFSSIKEKFKLFHEKLLDGDLVKEALAGSVDKRVGAVLSTFYDQVRLEVFDNNTSVENYKADGDDESHLGHSGRKLNMSGLLADSKVFVGPWKNTDDAQKSLLELLTNAAVAEFPASKPMSAEMSEAYKRKVSATQLANAIKIQELKLPGVNSNMPLKIDIAKMVLLLHQTVWGVVQAALLANHLRQKSCGTAAWDWVMMVKMAADVTELVKAEPEASSSQRPPKKAKEVKLVPDPKVKNTVKLMASCLERARNLAASADFATQEMLAMKGTSLMPINSFLGKMLKFQSAFVEQSVVARVLSLEPHSTAVKTYAPQWMLSITDDAYDEQYLSNFYKTVKYTVIRALANRLNDEIENVVEYASSVGIEDLVSFLPTKSRLDDALSTNKFGAKTVALHVAAGTIIQKNPDPKAAANVISIMQKINEKMEPREKGDETPRPDLLPKSIGAKLEEIKAGGSGPSTPSPAAAGSSSSTAQADTAKKTLKAKAKPKADADGGGEKSLKRPRKA